MNERPRFSAVYRDYKDILYTYVLVRVGHDPEQAEDVVSDVFVKVFKHYDRYDQTYALSTWLFTITRNTLIDHYRKRKDMVALEEFEHTGSDDPFYALLQRDMTEQTLSDAVAALPELQQACVRKQFLEGLTSKEVSTSLNISPAAARKHVSRALSTLRHKLLQFVLLVGTSSSVLPV